ncbi:MAG: ATP-grasp domain-containing protein [Acidimicrobiia bacterium]|nr:ATP-grasp domain-containing protein [Acidimicrobiia bacterium]
MITKLLIANRGEIARRIMRTAREMGIATVAVYSEADADAPFVQDADESVALDGVSAIDTYLNIPAIVDCALRVEADTVHPGYGFLAESADFARACLAAGLLFVGPTPDAIETMGDKLKAKSIMETAGVPTLPSAEITPDDLDGAARSAEHIGFPVLVKATAGGGGKGMRIVDDAASLGSAIQAAAREATAAFGDGRVFLEKYLVGPRHVEVQIFGDTEGTVVHLFERDCSVQRRHQKIIEEAPSPAVTDELRSRMGATAVAAGQAVGYVGAGTVEFLLSDGEFWFLEMNTRLQVEHPVTELVTGLDLVRLQLTLAAGAAIPDEVRSATLSGHAIEARLYAEDPRNGFLPSTGTIHRFRIDGARTDAGVVDGSEVSIHYDPMIAKVIARGVDRPEAIRRLVHALRTAQIHGVTTNRDLLVRILLHPDFADGSADTSFLEHHPPAEMATPLADSEARRRHALAAALAGQAARRQATGALASVPSGWRNSPSQSQEVSFDDGGETIDVEYRFGRDGVEAAAGGHAFGTVVVHGQEPGEVDLAIDGRRSLFRTHRVGDIWFVDSPDGSSRLVELPRFPVAHTEHLAGSLTAPMPGKVVSVDVSPGDVVEVGDQLLIIEAMKMEHAIVSPTNGTVGAVTVSPGDQVEPDQVLVVIDEA